MQLLTDSYDILHLSRRILGEDVRSAWISHLAAKKLSENLHEGLLAAVGGLVSANSLVYFFQINGLFFEATFENDRKNSFFISLPGEIDRLESA